MPQKNKLTALMRFSHKPEMPSVALTTAAHPQLYTSDKSSRLVRACTVAW